MVKVPVVTTLEMDDPGIKPGHGRGHHRRLGRAAAHVAKQRKGQLDEVVACTGLFQQRAEQHEQEDDRGGHAKRHAEHAFGLHPVMPQRLAVRRPFHWMTSGSQSASPKKT
jgi:hypothetical protein